MSDDRNWSCVTENRPSFLRTTFIHQQKISANNAWKPATLSGKSELILPCLFTCNHLHSSTSAIELWQKITCQQMASLVFRFGHCLWYNRCWKLAFLQLKNYIAHRYICIKDDIKYRRVVISYKLHQVVSTCTLNTIYTIMGKVNFR